MTKAAQSALKVAEAQRRLSKAELLKPAIVEEAVYMESLGGEVVIRSLSFSDRRRLNEETKAGTEEFDEENYQLKSIQYSLVDPELSAEEVEELKAQDGRVIDELIMAITMLNMVGSAKNLKKESSETQS
jgi:hypothetical protein